MLQRPLQEKKILWIGPLNQKRSSHGNPLLMTVVPSVCPEAFEVGLKTYGLTVGSDSSHVFPEVLDGGLASPYSPHVCSFTPEQRKWPSIGYHCPLPREVDRPQGKDWHIVVEL
jgi:hypothetical protein